MKYWLEASNVILDGLAILSFCFESREPTWNIPIWDMINYDSLAELWLRTIVFDAF